MAESPADTGSASVRRSRGITALPLAALDAAIVAVATVIGYYVRFEGLPPINYEPGVPWAVVIAAVTYVALFAVFGLYRQVLRYVGVDTVLKITAASVIAAAILLTADLFYGDPGVRLVPIGVLLIQWLLTLLGAAAARLSVRVFAYVGAGRGVTLCRVLIAGAGDAGSLLLRDIENQPSLGLKVVGFLDDDPALAGRTIRGVPVVGTTADLAQVAARRRAEEVLVALPDGSRDTIRRVLGDAADAGVRARIMPRLVPGEGAAPGELRKVEADDLLARDPAPVDAAQLLDTLGGRIVAVTGAAGSLGAELCRQLLTLEPARLVLIDQDEAGLYELWRELERAAPGSAVARVCDVREPAKLDAVFDQERPQVVLHAAGYRRVPLMEAEPDEAVLANVLGTRTVIDCCTRYAVDRLVLVSSHKAAVPASVLGATKAIAEQLVLRASASSSTTMMAVRLGNLLGSRAGVVRIFEDQLARRAPLTVTDPEATRYFMTIPEAARLVLQAQAIGSSGDVLVVDMGEPVRIIDLARRMMALSGVESRVSYIGLRDGEKQHEDLVDPGQRLDPTAHERIRRLAPLAEVPETFEADVRALEAAATARDAAGIGGALAALLPGYGNR